VQVSKALKVLLVLRLHGLSKGSRADNSFTAKAILASANVHSKKSIITMQEEEHL
jgi:hypothetical protein